jgi:hypothetical protein
MGPILEKEEEQHTRTNETCNLSVKGTMFSHFKICKHTWTSPDGKRHNETDHILIDRRRQSIYLMSDTGYCLEVAELRDRLLISKSPTQ